MKIQVQNIIRMTNRTGHCERVFSVAGTDYDFFSVELNSVRGLHYQERHSHALKVTVHRRFENNNVREYRNIEMTGDIIQDTDTVLGLVREACSEMGINAQTL